MMKRYLPRFWLLWIGCCWITTVAAQPQRVEIGAIVLTTESQAESVLQQLKAGADFAEIAARYSVGPGSTNGGRLGFFAPGDLRPELEQAVAQLDEGGYSYIVAIDNRYYILTRFSTVPIQAPEQKSSPLFTVLSAVGILFLIKLLWWLFKRYIPIRQFRRLNQQMYQLHAEGKVDAALEIALTLLEKNRQYFGDKSRETAEALSNAAFLHDARGDSRAAEPLYREGLEIARDRNAGHGSPAMLKFLNPLGDIYWGWGDYERAAQYFQEALDINRKQLGDGHPDLFQGHEILAQAYQQLGDIEKSGFHHRQVIEIAEKHQLENPAIVSTLNALAEQQRLKGDYTQSLALSLRALEMIERHTSEDHPDLRNSLSYIGGLYMDQGRYHEARPYYQRLLEITEKRYGNRHLNYANALFQLADMQRLQGNYGDAERHFIGGLGILEKHFGPGHLEVANALMNLASLHVEQGKFTEGEPLYKRVLKIQEAIYSSEHPEVARTLSYLGDLFHTQGRYTEAESSFVRALNISEKVFGPNHAHTAKILMRLTHLYIPQGRYGEAGSYYQRTLQIYDRIFGPFHPDVLNLLRLMVEFYQNTGQTDEARRLQERMRSTEAKN